MNSKPKSALLFSLCDFAVNLIIFEVGVRLTDPGLDLTHSGGTHSNYELNIIILYLYHLLTNRSD